MTRRAYLGVWGVAGAVWAEERIERHETIDRTFTLNSQGQARLLIDNVNGGIKVTGGTGRTIKVRAERLTRARNNEKADVAQREVKLDIDQQGNEVRMYVDGPFRAPDGIHNRGWDYNGYSVQFDYEVQVPRDIDLVVKTVNSGSIVVDNVRGEFKIQHVNGPITLTRLAGAGSVETVNGPVTAEMDVPRAATSFKTLNGKVEVRFPANLSADIKVKNRWNGAIYTDFEIKPLPSLPVRVEQVDSKMRYHVNEFAAFRVGAGGPELSFETFNGTIRILSQSR